MKPLLSLLALAASLSTAQAAVVVTQDPTTVQAFQQGLVVETFENVHGRTAMPLPAYTNGLAVDENAQVFNEVAGVLMSVGGNVGTNRPGLYQLQGDVQGDAHSGNTVLGPVDFDGTTLFGRGALLELFFPTKVSAAGFWLNPSLGGAKVYAVNTIFAFSGDPDEQILSEAIVAPGGFVAFSFSQAVIGGLKIGGLPTGGGGDDEGDQVFKGFTIDDLSYSRTSGNTVPTPSPLWLLGASMPLLLRRARGRA